MRETLELLHNFTFRFFLAFFIFITAISLITNPSETALKNVFFILTLIAVLCADNHLKHQDFKNLNFIRLASIIYLLLYLIIGLIFEIGFNKSRFETQGSFWIGTTSSMLILPILITAISNNEYLKKISAYKFAGLFFLIFFVIFYYQSRAGELFTFAVILILLNKISKQRWFFLFATFNLFIWIFPWTSTLKINELKIYNFCEGPVADLTVNTGFHSKYLEDYCIGPNSLTNRTNYFYCNLLPVSRCSYTLMKDTTSSEKDTTSSEKDTTSSEKDDDRKKVTSELIHFLLKNNLKTQFFGIGMNSNYDEFKRKIVDINNKNNLGFSENLLNNLTLSTFNHYLIFSGIVGICSFYLLFLFTFFRVYISTRYNMLIGISIGFIFCLTFVGQFHNLILLYLFISPNGLAVKIIKTIEKKIIYEDKST